MSFKKIVILFVTLAMICVTTSNLSGEETVTSVSISPENKLIMPMETFTVDIYCVSTEPVVAYEFRIAFDPTVLQANSVTKGDFFGEFDTMFNSGIINNTAGTIIHIYEVEWPTAQGNVSTPGIFATISFTALMSCEDSVLDLYDTGVTNEYQYIEIEVNDGLVETDCTYLFQWSRDYDVTEYWLRVSKEEELVINLTDVNPTNYPSVCFYESDIVLFAANLESGVYEYQVE